MRVVTGRGENPTQGRRSTCCWQRVDSRSVIAMSENTPTNPHDSEPQGAEFLESQTPEETPESDRSIGAAAIVNAPPTSEISEGSDIGEADDSPQVPLATEAGQFRTAPMDLEVPFSRGAAQQHGSAQQPGSAQDQQPQATSYPTQQYTQAYPQTRAMNANSPQGFSQPTPSQPVPTQQAPAQRPTRAYPPQQLRPAGPGSPQQANPHNPHPPPAARLPAAHLRQPSPARPLPQPGCAPRARTQRADADGTDATHAATSAEEAEGGEHHIRTCDRGNAADA